MVMKDCRMYEPKFPEVDDVVMVQVKSIAEMGAYVELMEYNNIEGMVLLSELSRKRIRSITRIIKVGRQEPVMVLRVDKEKGYIDLSKRRVSQEDIAKCEEKYGKSKLVHSIMRHVAETTGEDLEQLNSEITWPLYRTYGHAFEAFKQMVADQDEVIGKLEGTAPVLKKEDVLEALMKNIRRRMTPQPVKFRADVEMTCFHYGGIEHIKSAMRAAEAVGTELCPIKMKLVAPPLYVLTTQTLERTKGVEILDEACEACKTSIENNKGKLVIVEKGRMVSDRDEFLWRVKLQELDDANREVSGDEDSSEGED